MGTAPVQARGFLIGVAAAFKLTPGLFGVYLLCRCKWSGVSGMAIAGLVCTVLLPVLVWGYDGAFKRHVSWMDKVLAPVLSRDTHEFIDRVYRNTNQSLAAATVRYLSECNAGSKRNSCHVNLADPGLEDAERVALVLFAGSVLVGLMMTVRLCRQLSAATIGTLVLLGLLLFLAFPLRPPVGEAGAAAAQSVPQ